MQKNLSTRLYCQLFCFTFIVTLLPCNQLYARFIRPQLEEVPVERLAKNLEAIAKQNPKDVTYRFNVARLHAMAYALKTDKTPVQKNNLKRGAWFGYTPKNAPFTIIKTTDKEKLKAAKKQLAKAIENYESAIKLDPKHLPSQLGYGWCLVQAGKKKEAITQLRTTIKTGWGKEKDQKFGRMGGHFITSESAEYLIPLLDAKKDAKEIKELQDRTAQLKALPRPITPIIIPLKNNLQLNDLIAPNSKVRFDADGTGRDLQWSWITKDAGWLVYDKQGTGNINSAIQMFGQVSFWLFWDNGYQAMRALDDNRDGLLRGKELKHLAIWQDRNGNGISDPGEVQSLKKWGIVELSCEFQTGKKSTVAAFNQKGVLFKDGTRRSSYDILLQPKK